MYFFPSHPQPDSRNQDISINKELFGIKLILKMQCPTHVKKLEKITDAKTDTCELCGRRAVYECKSCTYVQCDQCRICNKKHGLIKIIELNKVKPEYYNNSYSCNSCSKSRNVDDDGIWHCNSCNYDLCPDCCE